MKDARQANRFLVLDGLRGLAAVMVVWGHLATMTGIWFPGRVLAVDLFFMISGFIIPYSYEGKLRSGMRFGTFFELRVTRLYPLYILGCGISLLPYPYFVLKAHALWPLHGPASWLPWALVVLPQPHYGPERSFLLNPPAWTLSLEYIVNFAYVLALPWLTTRVLAMVAATATVALAVATVHFGTVDFGTGGIQFIWGLSRVGCPFSIGALLYRLWATDRLPRWPTPVPVVAALFLLTMPLLTSGLEGPWLDLVVVVLIFPVLTVMGITSTASGLAAKGCHGLGELSYPLYTLHLPLLVVATQFAPLLGLSTRAAALTMAPAAILIAAVSIRIYDKPARALLRRAFDLRRRDVSAAPPL